MWTPNPIRITNGKVFTEQVINNQKLTLNGVDQGIFLGALADFIIDYFRIEGTVEHNSAEEMFECIRQFYLGAMRWKDEGLATPKHKVLYVRDSDDRLSFRVKPKTMLDLTFHELGFINNKFGLSFDYPPVLQKEEEYIISDNRNNNPFVIKALVKCYLPDGAYVEFTDHPESKDKWLAENKHLIIEVKKHHIVHSGYFHSIQATAKSM
ncbi:hypothetical protein [Vibrio phage BONAISHI]|nr:hypothetical protein [Vibrio phage BONAISHI]